MSFELGRLWLSGPLLETSRVSYLPDVLEMLPHPPQWMLRPSPASDACRGWLILLTMSLLTRDTLPLPAAYCCWHPKVSSWGKVFFACKGGVSLAQLLAGLLWCSQGESVAHGSGLSWSTPATPRWPTIAWRGGRGYRSPSKFRLFPGWIPNPGPQSYNVKAVEVSGVKLLASQRCLKDLAPPF